jgi:hypothetical protein
MRILANFINDQRELLSPLLFPNRSQEEVNLRKLGSF